MLKMGPSEQKKQKLEAVSAFSSLFRLLMFGIKFCWQMPVHSVLFLAFSDGTSKFYEFIMMNLDL